MICSYGQGIRLNCFHQTFGGGSWRGDSAGDLRSMLKMNWLHIPLLLPIGGKTICDADSGRSSSSLRSESDVREISLRRIAEIMNRPGRLVNGFVNSSLCSIFELGRQLEPVGVARLL